LDGSLYYHAGLLIINMNKTFLILGGYGNAGRLIAELLLQETPVQLVLAGRNLEQAQRQAQILNQKFNTHRVAGVYLDAADLASLKAAFAQVDLVVVASSTRNYVENIAQAALIAGIDYLDLQFSSAHKIQILETLRKDIEQAGLCFITEGGFHPGLLSTLIRYVAPEFDHLETAQLASLIQTNWRTLSFSPATVTEFIQEIIEAKPMIFKEGDWIQLDWNSSQPFQFGNTFGQRNCVPLFMEELRELPQTIPSLKELGFFIAGFNWVTDYLILPLSLALLRFFPSITPLVSSLFQWGLNTFSKPPYGVILMLIAQGQKDNKPITMQLQLLHWDAYLLTAAPVVACLLQYLDGTLPKSGLWYQGNVVNPKRMLSDIEGLGVRFEIRKMTDLGL
jgi:Saccharopine dehydrogenase NADP binding domain